MEDFKDFTEVTQFTNVSLSIKFLRNGIDVSKNYQNWHIIT